MPHQPAAALWHGPSPSRAEIAAYIEAAAHYPLSALSSWATDSATVPAPCFASRQHQTELLGRTVSITESKSTGQNRDHSLAAAIVQLRLQHDQAALDQLQQAAQVTVKAHLQGMQATSRLASEAEMRAEIESVFMAHHCPAAYASIVTVHGEILHNDCYPHPLQSGDLLLVDAGAETPSGWAADVTRIWPVSGTFSPSQRDLYEIVLAAHDVCIAKIAPGVEFRDLHLLAALTIASGLVDLGILQGNPEVLVERMPMLSSFPMAWAIYWAWMSMIWRSWGI